MGSLLYSLSEHFTDTEFIFVFYKSRYRPANHLFRKKAQHLRTAGTDVYNISLVVKRKEDRIERFDEYATRDLIRGVYHRATFHQGGISITRWEGFPDLLRKIPRALVKEKDYR